MSDRSSSGPRVLHVIETLGVGGAERVLAQMLPALRDRGVESQVAVLRPPYTLAEELEEQGFAVHRLDRPGMWNLPGGARALARLARAQSCGIIHANLFFPTVYTALAKRLFAPKFKALTTFHNLAYAPGANRRGPTYGLRKRLNRWSVRNGIDARIAVSHAVADHYGEALNARDIRVIHNPVPVDAALSVLESGAEQWPGKGGGIKLILPGRLVHEKGHADLLDALEILRREELDVSVVFAGDGPLREALKERIAASDLSIHITGLLPHDRLLRLIAAADISVIPSRFEGFGLTAAESLVALRGVIATNVGGLTDIVRDGETGLLVPPRDAKALAEAIGKLAADPALRARLGEAGLVHVRAQFDAPVVATKLAELYRGLVNR